MTELRAELRQIAIHRLEHIDGMRRTWEIVNPGDDDLSPEELITVAGVHDLAKMLGLNCDVSLCIPAQRPSLADELAGLWDVSAVRLAVSARPPVQPVVETPVASAASLPAPATHVRLARVVRLLVSFRSRLAVGYRRQVGRIFLSNWRSMHDD
jgi:hypothetical protein